MEGTFKKVKQTPESVKFTLKVRERQNKMNTPKSVNKTPMGLPLSPEQFEEFRRLYLCRSNNKVSKL